MLISKEFCAAKEQIIGKISIRQMMHKNCLIMFVFVFVFLFRSAKIVDEYI
jgi:hypothetical protein